MGNDPSSSKPMDLLSKAWITAVFFGMHFELVAPLPFLLQSPDPLMTKNNQSNNANVFPSAIPMSTGAHDFT